MVAKQNRFWRIARNTFRGFRQIVLFLVLALLGAAVYLNTIGLPDFVKRPLLDRLRAEGWEVSFQNMRWNLYRGVIIDQPSFRQTNESSFQFSAARTDFDIDWLALKDSALEIHGIELLGGDFVLPQTNRAPLQVRGLKAKLRFRPGDEVDVAAFDANVQGARVNIHGTLSNASALFAKKAGESQTKKVTVDLQDIWDVLDKMQLQNPEISLSFRGDARELQKLQSELSFAADAGNSEWGKATGITLHAQLNSAEKPVSMELACAAITSPQCTANAVTCRITAAPTELDSAIWTSELQLAAQQIEVRAASNSINAASAQLNGLLTNSLENFDILGASGRLLLINGSSDVPSVRADATFERSEFAFNFNPLPKATNSGEWSFFKPFTGTWTSVVRELKTPKLTIENIKSTASWKWPKLSPQISAQIGGRPLRASGDIDVNTRRIHAEISSEVDPASVASLLPHDAKKFVTECAWEQPPKIEARIDCNLPHGTNQTVQLDELLTTLQLEASFSVGPMAFRRIQMLSAASNVQFSNGVWRLPNFRIVRGDGKVEADLTTDVRTLAFHCFATSSINPQIIGSQLPPTAKAVLLDDLQFSSTPAMRAELTGHWNELENTSVKAYVTATNLVFRKIPIDLLRTDLEFTNNVLVVSNGYLEQGGGRATVPQLRVDLRQQRVFFKELEGNIDPLLVTSAIAQEAYDAIEPYRYATPPQISLNGSIAFTQIDDADMHFSVRGKNFQWQWFKADEASADVHWLGRDLIVTNAQASAYGNGYVTGWTTFDFRPKGKADYRFDVSVSNINVQTFARSLNATNSIEGSLSGYLTINSADTTAIETWQGFGRMELRDGLIWDVPIVGVFSPVLDAMIPGFGRNRAREATGDFIITNGVAVSDNVEIRASTFRMQYRGTVDAHWRVSAKVMAEVLRDAPGVGRVVSLAFMPLSKLFEYRISGDLRDPKADPVYVPKFVMMTLRPFHTMKQFLRDNSDDRSGIPGSNEGDAVPPKANP